MGLFSNKSFQRIYTIILVVGCMAFALPLLAHAYNGIFMRLNGDEYCYLAVQSQHGFWGTQWYSYQSVSGLYNGNRFSLNFALAVLGELGPRLPSITPALALILLFTGWFFAFWQVKKFWSWKFNFIEAALLTEGFIFFTLYIVTDVTQILYWYGGMAQYMSPIILNGFILGLIFLSTRPVSKIWLILLVALSFMSGGFSETPGVVQAAYLAIFSLSVFLVYRQSHDVQVKKLLLPSTLALVGTILALLALALAPSTAPRLSTSSHPSLLETLFYSLKYGINFIIGTLLSTPLPLFLWLLLAFLLAVALRYKLTHHTPLSIKTAIGIMAMILAVWYLLCSVSMSPSVYAQNAYPGERALLPARFISIIFIFCLGWLIGKTVHLPGKLNSNQAIFSFVVLVLIGVLWAYPLRAVPKITSNVAFYQKWSIIWDARDEQIIQAKENGQKDIAVINMDHPIKDVGELSPDPSYWYNVCASQYYGVNTIKAGLPGWDQ
jgi:hypothetical protein